MLRKVFRVGLLVMAGVVGAALVAGPDTLADLVATVRGRVQTHVRDFVDPEVELDRSVGKALGGLPRHISSLTLALRDVKAETARQTKALGELRQADEMIARDLRHLAPAVRRGQVCELRGRKLSADECRTEAVRLYEKKRKWDQMAGERRALIETLRARTQEIEHALAKAKDAARDFGQRVREAKAKIGLVRANENVAEVTKLTSTHAASADTSTASLIRRLDAKLVEQRQASDMRASIADPDTHLDEVRKANVFEAIDREYGGKAEHEKEPKK